MPRSLFLHGASEIRVVAKYGSPLIAAGNHMVEGIRNIEAGRARHTSLSLDGEMAGTQRSGG